MQGLAVVDTLDYYDYFTISPLPRLIMISCPLPLYI